MVNDTIKGNTYIDGSPTLASELLYNKQLPLPNQKEWLPAFTDCKYCTGAIYTDWVYGPYLSDAA